MEKAYIVLETGEVFQGFSFGAKKESVGEIVFATGMVGYIETLTDPSYYGQMVVQTFPLIGNYGIIEEDFESDSPALFGYIVKEWCDTPSNFRSEKDLDTFLKEKEIPGVYGIDTRKLTKIIREYGVMNAKITYDLNSVNLEEIKNYKIINALENVSCKESKVFYCKDKKYSVALMDYGQKQNIVRELVKRGCEVTVLPYNTKSEDILNKGYDGIMLSNGPGDPAENVECIAEISKMIGKLPIFGICLGHQLLALASGGKTEKLKYGHRGANQPVKDISSGRVYITSQNHGYTVLENTVTGGYANFLNSNDGTCEGMKYPKKQAFSVQFHPEACSGPKDTEFLFGKFINMMGENKDVQ